MGTFRYLGIHAAESRAQLSGVIVREALTSHMIAGSSEYQEQLLKQIEKVDGVKATWVVRSDSLVRQYGRGTHPQEPRDDLDRNVLRDGNERETISGALFTDTLYRLTIPYVATDKGKIDCLSCHDAKAGDVLGVVSIEIEINDIKTLGLIASVLITILFIAAIFYLLKSVRRYVSSYQDTLEGVSVAMEKAEEGDYSHRVKPSEGNNGYSALMWTNSVMEKFDATLKDSTHKLTKLVQIDKPNSDALYTLQKGINQLYEVENFRNAIEKDQTTDEVYGRIAALLRNRWGVGDFNIFEINPLNKKTSMIHSEKVLLCDAASGCRADRANRKIDSTEYEGSCPKMIDPNAHYLCHNYPITDDLDIVISLVCYDERELTKMRSIFGELGNYINAARVQIINKKLQDTVRIDSLTQLYNRVYLEELCQIMNDQSRRKVIPCGVLMIDMDQFDAINQAYDKEVGDEVIKAMARNIQECLQPGDILIRYGIDTFAVVLYDYDAAQTVEMAEMIRLSFKKKIRINTYAILKTVSIGISFFPQQTDDMIEAIEWSKRALLEAKHKTGNCSLVFDKGTMPI
ncbi:MAG: GGDEF domain-containing protein [Sulfuricurvum sp.]|nr:GGDEF domain-containing protein [Sulfuricurvum sp.]